jgi:uncharacterized protein
VRRVVADTNIYISAFIFGGNPLRLLDSAVDGDIHLFISQSILDEVLRVMRVKFRRSDVQLRQAEELILSMTHEATPTERLSVIKEDPDDDRILECAVETAADFIVTGDRDLLRLKHYRNTRIVTVSDFFTSTRGHAKYTEI